MKKIFFFFVVAISISINAAANESEIRDWYQNYANHWLKANPDINQVAKFYASPFYYLSGEGPSVDSSETMRKALKEYANTWKQQGWVGSKLISLKVKKLNDSSAIILTEWDIYDKNGNSLIGCSKAPWTYLAAKTDEGWKFTLEIEQACDRRLSID